MPSERVLDLLVKAPTIGPEGDLEIWDELTHELELLGETISINRHFDRDGEPITLRQWVVLMTVYPEEKIVDQTLVPPYWVSTVWLGLDHGFGFGAAPLIFETMVFNRVTGESDLDCWRYSTEAEAREGHARAVAQAEAMAKLTSS